MMVELKAVTDPGRLVVDLAEEHSSDFATRAGEHDRKNTYVGENFAAMKETGFLGACAPAEFGGLGLTSIHDLAVAISRLARGCPSTAIGATMHMVAVFYAARAWREACLAGNSGMADAMEGALRGFARSEAIVSGAGTEPGNTWCTPLTVATPIEGGYRINGHKAFGTNSEIADVIRVRARIPGPPGELAQHAFINVPRETPGLEVRRTWDALGMRGSGSHDVVFTDCVVPASATMLVGPVGPPPVEAWASINANQLVLMGANLGIAEAARTWAVEFARTAMKEPYPEPIAHRPGVQHLVAEMDTGLASMRGVLSRSGLLLDEAFAAIDGGPTGEDAWSLAAEVQCAKLIVDRTASEVVDHAMSVSGGAGYLSKNPLSRMYRDVRAGSFMQPHSPVEAWEFIGRIGLGLDPDAALNEALAQQAAVVV